MEFVMKPIRIGDLLLTLWLHTDVDPPAASWDCAAVEINQILELEPDIALRGLVVSDGGTPNREQREQVRQLTVRAMSKLSVVTNAMSNPVVRGAAAVLRMLIPGITFYRPEDLDEAVAYLGIPPESLPMIQNELRRMQEQLQPVKALAQMARAL